MNEYLTKWCCLILFDLPFNWSKSLAKLASVSCAKRVYLNKVNDAASLSDDTITVHQLMGDTKTAQLINAFDQAFAAGYRKVILVKSNLDQLQPNEIIEGFNCLKMIEFCIGPKSNGDYYLLGMNYFEPSLLNIEPSDPSLTLKQTIKAIGNLKLVLYKLKTIYTPDHAASSHH